MATTERPRPRPPFLIVVLNYLSYLLLFAVCGAMLFIAWPMIQARIVGAPATTFATSAPAGNVGGQTRQIITDPAPHPAQQAVATPIPGIAQNEATSMAVYQATVQAANVAQPAVVPNTDNTNDSAPLLREQITIERQPAPAVVPTAEPVQDTQIDSQFGSKPIIVNPQETHECRHAQVWIDGQGCKNPTPVGGG